MQHNCSASINNSAGQRSQFPVSIKLSLMFVLIGLLCLLAGDFQITTLTPWLEFKRMALGIMSPRWMSPALLFDALLKTLAYAFVAVAVASVIGGMLAFVFHLRSVRIFCAVIRSVHELFWGLLFIQLFGLHPLSGLLAIILPFSAIFAKVYAEMLEELHHQPKPWMPEASGRIERFWFGDWPRLKTHWWHYTLYRLECGLRSSTLLGFIGLPTLGFYLESAFMQGHYPEVAGLLLVFYVLIISLRWWLRPRLLWIYALVALFWLVDSVSINWALAVQLLHDMVPAPIRNDVPLLPWLSSIVVGQIGPGVWQTLLISQLALVGSAVLGLVFFPLVSQHFGKPLGRFMGAGSLVVFRSTPELFIAFALLLLWGPSLLPAVVALSLHNGAIIGHLLGCYSDQIKLRVDATKGINRYGYELLPRLYGQFLAFSFYRWEVIMRDTAILGLLGIHTLGFYIDSAFQAFQMDVAVVLIACTALLNCAVDGLSRYLRRQLHLDKAVKAYTVCP